MRRIITLLPKLSRFIANLPKLAVNLESEELAQALLSGPVPKNAAADAAHIAIAAANNVDFLLTWNCKHISNPKLRRDIMQVCNSMGHRCPIICSPIDFLEDYYGQK